MVDASFSFEKSRSQIDVVADDVVNFRLLDVTIDINKVDYRIIQYFCFFRVELCLIFPKGELVCIEGPVGEGKTTLLEAMLGKLRCDSGTVGFNNRLAGECHILLNSLIRYYNSLDRL